MEILIKAAQLILSLSILVVLHELGHFIPAKLFKTRVNSSLKSKDSMSQDNIINVNISSFMFDQYDVYSGSSLRALESEVKSSLKISINQNGKIKNKMLMSMKRFTSIELNPIAEEEMISFIKNEMLDDLYNQVILEVSLIDM